MKYLLDTHVFLWMLADPARLNEKATKIIQNPNKGGLKNSNTFSIMLLACLMLCIY
jgi:PIN domain nuclease of toxin-antitoxin system